jgi:hypothetical protein
MTNGSVPPAGYEQPEYSGLAPSGPSAPGPPDRTAAPEPPRAAERMLATSPNPPASTPPPAADEVDADAGQPARPLWPSAWPASSGGAYADQRDVYTADQVKRLSADEPADTAQGERKDAGEDEPADAGDHPDEANTRFW